MTSLQQAISDLFAEVFRGTAPGADGTWFVQGNEALDATLAALTAEEASASPGTGISSIAAHVIHTAYYLELANDGLRGVERDGDWAGSWKKQAVDAAAWAEAQENLRRQKERFLEFVATEDLGANQERLTYAIANIGHVAYHLGAIRQLFLVAKALGR